MKQFFEKFSDILLACIITTIIGFIDPILGLGIVLGMVLSLLILNK